MFILNPRLEADTLHVAEWPLCLVRLMNDATYPWLILVPKRHGVTEIHELDETDRHLLADEIAQASHRLQIATNAFKINIAALGNVVPQLHVHVIARYQDDPAWPAPVWGRAPAVPYRDDAQTAWITKLK